MTKHPDISQPHSVTHYLCPDGPTQDGAPAATHHLVPRGGVQTCRHCGQTEKRLREQLDR